MSKCNEIEQALATVTTRWSLANPYLWWNSVWNLLHWHFWIWLAACLNDLVYSNTNSRQPCYISLLSLKSAGIFQQHWPWVLCVYFTWCRIYVNQDENFCYTHFVSSLNKYLWYLGPNHFALLKATLCQAWCKTKVLHLASGALHGKFSWRNYVLTSDLLINEVNGWTL